MILPFFRRELRSHTSTDDGRRRLHKLLTRCHVDHHRDEPEAALRRLPFSSPPRQSASRRVQKFRFPIPMPARIALFEGEFEGDGALRVFSAAETASLKKYVPDALVAPLQFALTLADQKRRGLVDFPALTTAVIVLTSLADEPLADQHRDLLWQTFRVPVFEQLRGWDGAVLARECEVHDGLHIDPSALIAEMHGAELIATQLTALEDPIVRVTTGFSAEIVGDHCECGLETPRLRNLEAIRPLAKIATAS